MSTGSTIQLDRTCSIPAVLSNMPPSFDHTPMNPPSRGPMQAPWTGMDRCYVGMREVSASDRVDHDVVARDALAHHLAAQAAFDSRRIREAERREWAAAAVGILWLMLSLGALLVINAGYVWG